MDAMTMEKVLALIVFALFAGTLVVLVLPKIGKALGARETKQREDLSAAEKAAEEASKKLAEYETQLADAKQQAAKIRSEAEVAAEARGVEMQAAAEHDVEQMRHRFSRDVDTAREGAVAALYTRAADVATAVAAKILENELTANDQQILVSESLAQLQKSAN